MINVRPIARPVQYMAKCRVDDQLVGQCNVWPGVEPMADCESYHAACDNLLPAVDLGNCEVTVQFVIIRCDGCVIVLDDQFFGDMPSLRA